MGNDILEHRGEDGETAVGSRGGGGGGVAWKLAVVVIVAVVMAVLVSMHVQGINGPWYWQWKWRRLETMRLWPAMAVAAAPVFAGVVLYAKRKIRPAVAIVFLMAGMLAMQVAAMSAQPPFGLSRMVGIVENAVNTSYWTDAKILWEQENIHTSEWLLQYPEIMPLLHLHAKYKPPGLVLYYLFFIEVFGPGHAGSLAGGMVMAVLATFGIAGVYLLIRTFGGDADSAFYAASFYALCPAPILFWPQFDQIYPAIACAMLILWGRALFRGKIGYAVALGAVLALAVFMSYIFLVMGLFLAVLSMLHMGEKRWPGVSRVLVFGLSAVMTVVVLYWLLSQATGFDPIATFESAAHTQAIDLLPLMRPFPRHILFDFIDFDMAAGWIGFLFVAFWLLRAKGGGSGASKEPSWRSERRLVFLSLLQIVVTGFAALLPGETARLWLPMLPLLMVPIGFELARWPTRSRLVVLAVLWMSTVVIAQNMIFIFMGDTDVRPS